MWIERLVEPLLRQRAATKRSGQLLNQADLARDVGIVGSTAAAWLSVLQASHQLVLVEPWFGNASVSLVKRPKLFLRDAGLAAFLCGIHGVDELRASPLVGALWEALVCAEMRRLQSSRQGGWQLNFWQDRTREADFLAHRGGRFHLADAKWTERPRARDVGSLRKVMTALAPEPVESLSIVCRAHRTFIPSTLAPTRVPLIDLPGVFAGE